MTDALITHLSGLTNLTTASKFDIAYTTSGGIISFDQAVILAGKTGKTGGAAVDFADGVTTTASKLVTGSGASSGLTTLLGQIQT